MYAGDISGLRFHSVPVLSESSLSNVRRNFSKQDCGLFGTSGQLQIGSNGRDEYLLYILTEKFGVHVWDLPNFSLQVHVLSDTLLKNSRRFWMRSVKGRGISISRCRDTTKQCMMADRSIDWIMKS
jgi:hypothetical protein